MRGTFLSLPMPNRNKLRSRLTPLLGDTAVVDTALRRSGVSYLGFPIVWRRIIVPEGCSSVECW